MYLLSQLMLLSKPTNLHPQISTATFWGCLQLLHQQLALIAYQSINKGCAVCILYPITGPKVSKPVLHWSDSGQSDPHVGSLT